MLAVCRVGADADGCSQQQNKIRMDQRTPSQAPVRMAYAQAAANAIKHSQRSDTAPAKAPEKLLEKKTVSTTKTPVTLPMKENASKDNTAVTSTTTLPALPLPSKSLHHPRRPARSVPPDHVPEAKEICEGWHDLERDRLNCRNSNGHSTFD